MRYCVCPIVFLRQTEKGVALKINGYDVGYEKLIYYKKDNVLNKKMIELKTNEIFIEAKKFPLGKGYYCFILAKDEEYSAPSLFYLSFENKDDTLDKVASYIINPEDLDYIEKKGRAVLAGQDSYTESLVKIYRKTENRQPFEIKSLYQFINGLERYENAMALHMNRVNIGSTYINYETGFKIIPSELITSVETYMVEEDGHRELIEQCKLSYEELNFCFKPDTLYIISLLIDGEIAVELLHYEFDEQGISYLWAQEMANIEYIKSIQESSLEFSSQVPLTEEDIERLVAERSRENIDAFMPRLIVRQSMYHDGMLNITIENYEALVAMEKTFYVSIRELDQFFDRTFDKRYKITSPTLTINAPLELLDGEIILFIEDERQIIVSPFTRFDLYDYAGFGEMSEYAEKQNAVEVSDYVNRYLKNITTIIGEGEFYTIVSNILHAQMYDSDITAQKIYYNTLVKSLMVQKLAKYSDDMLFFTATEWMSQHNIDSEFFEITPRFINALDTFIFPTSKNHYVLVVKKIMATEENTADVTYNFYASSPNRSISVNIAKGDIYIIYAIDAQTYKRSGFIIVNNVHEREYFTSQIKLEALASGEQ